MQPTFSPDGRFWWDGRQWQPVPGPPPRRRRRGPLMVAGAIALVVIVMAAAAVRVVSWIQPAADGSNPASDGPGSTLTPGESVTEEKLSRVSAGAFYRALLTRQMTRPVSVITGSSFFRGEFEQRMMHSIKQVGIDHRSGSDLTDKQWTGTRSSFLEGEPDGQVRCVDGYEHYLLRPDDTEWSRSDDPCHLEGSWGSGVSDGIAATGLSEEEAAKVIGLLRDTYPEFTQPRQPSLVTASDRTYIRQIVDFKPVKLGDDHYWGTQFFTWAFKESGRNALTWPFSSGYAPGAGLRVAYYLDPKTLLPVASLARSTPTLNSDGSASTPQGDTRVHAYSFPDRLKPLTLDTKRLKLFLPEGWTMPE